MTGASQDVERAFREAVNMTAAELERWLATDASRSAGRRTDGGETVGHRSGRRIVRILRRRRDEITDADREHMREVTGFVRRHLAQRPAGDVRDTTWRHSLMNWGHDPLR